ncbi:hypothetical protein D043_3212 [Vibrio parahaemolyticus EKP-021]|nr:hypothetical protein D043_3212 [Vibrio parahaemolyticus EKP-021]
MNANNVPPTDTAIRTPAIAPSANASTTLVARGISTWLMSISGALFTSSGMRIFAINKPAGADIKAAAIR